MQQIKEKTPVIDWIGFTFHGRDPLGKMTQFEYFLKRFPEFDLEDKVYIKGRYSYDFSFLLTDTICVSYDSRQTDKGVNVQVSSSGIYDLAAVLKTDNAVDILRILKDRECKLSRIDIAFDDYDKVYTPSDYARFKDAHQLQIHAHRYMHIGSVSSKDAADTFYVGVRQSGKLLRIYDKNAESNGEFNCIRYEGEFHGLKAQYLHNYILNEGKITFSNFIALFLRVLKPNKNERMDAVDTLPEWEEFTNHKFNEEKLHLPCRRAVTTIESTAKFLKNTRRASVAAIQILGLDTFLDYINTVELDAAYKHLVQQERSKEDLYNLLLSDL